MYVLDSTNCLAYHKYNIPEMRIPAVKLYATENAEGEEYYGGAFIVYDEGDNDKEYVVFFDFTDADADEFETPYSNQFESAIPASTFAITGGLQVLKMPG